MRRDSPANPSEHSKLLAAIVHDTCTSCNAGLAPRKIVIKINSNNLFLFLFLDS